MAVETVNALIDELRQGRVLDEPQLAMIEREAAEQFSEPRQLAKNLVGRGWLTRYQAKQLLAGNGKELTLGAYRILDRLGSGGMGQVYKALHVPMSRVVALKVVRPELVADSKTLKRFRREVQAAGQLNHPNIVTVFDAAQIGNTHFLAMEFIDGVDCANLVRDSGPLEIALACDCIRQAALGLQHAHENGVIHRDVKPSNLLMTRNPPIAVKILDMGLARPASVESSPNAEHQSALTLDGTVLGTPDFMSPEQAKNSSTVDHRADIYSLGCTFYYLLTARMPFPVTNVMEKLIKHQFEQPYPVEMIRPEIPAPVAAGLQRMMAKDAGDRFQSAAEVALALAPYCADPIDRDAVTLKIPPTESKANIAEPATPTSSPSKDSSPFQFDQTSRGTKSLSRIAARNLRLGWILAGGGVLCAIAIVAVLLIALALSGRTKATKSESPATPGAQPDRPAITPVKFDKKPDPIMMSADQELLALCMPERTAFAAIVNVPKLLNATAIDSHFGSALKPLLDGLKWMKINPRTQCDRLAVFTLAGSPGRTLTILLGSYASDEVREFARRTFKSPAGDAQLPIGTLQLSKDHQDYLALLNGTYFAIATDSKLLRDAHRRLHNGKLSRTNETVINLLGSYKSDSTLRFAMVGSFTPGDEPLEAAGVEALAGELVVDDGIKAEANGRISNLNLFREKLHALSFGYGVRALFDPRDAIPAALLRNPQIEPVTDRNGSIHEIRIRNSVSARDLDVIFKAIARRLNIAPPTK